MTLPVYEEIARKYPSKAARAKTVPSAAVWVFCLQCMGGSRKDAGECEARECALWPHRPGTSRATRKALETPIERHLPSLESPNAETSPTGRGSDCEASTEPHSAPEGAGRA